MSYGFVVWWPGMENAECVSTLLEDNKTLSKSRFEKKYAKVEGVFAECNDWCGLIKDEGLIYISYEVENGVYDKNIINRFASKLHDAVKKPIIIFALFRMYDGIIISESQYIDKDCTVIRDSECRIDIRRLITTDYSQYVYQMNSTEVTDKIENKRYLVIYDKSIKIQYGQHDTYAGVKYNIYDGVKYKINGV